MTGRFNLYRDCENGMLCGVCAGLADRFELNPLGVRVLALVALVLYTIPTGAVYVAAAMLLRDRPLRYRGADDVGQGADPDRERRFWRRGIREP